MTLLETEKAVLAHRSALHAAIDSFSRYDNQQGEGTFTQRRIVAAIAAYQYDLAPRINHPVPRE